MRVPSSQLTDDMIRSVDSIVALDPSSGAIRPVYSLHGLFHVGSPFLGSKKGQVLEVEVDPGDATGFDDLSRRTAVVKNQQKDESARVLAGIHYEVEIGMTHIIRYSGSSDAQQESAEPIKLLEVNTNTVPSGVLALGFDAIPTAGIHFPSIIIEVTPAEFDKIRSNELKLPSGWEIQKWELPKPAISSRE